MKLTPENMIRLNWLLKAADLRTGNWIYGLLPDKAPIDLIVPLPSSALYMENAWGYSYKYCGYTSAFSGPYGGIGGWKGVGGVVSKFEGFFEKLEIDYTAEYGREFIIQVINYSFAQIKVPYVSVSGVISSSAPPKFTQTISYSAHIWSWRHYTNTFSYIILALQNETPPQSTAIPNAFLNQPYTYGENKYSTRLLLYVIKVVQGGSANEAQIVWLKIPFPFFAITYPSPGGLYSEGIPLRKINEDLIEVAVAYGRFAGDEVKNSYCSKNGSCLKSAFKHAEIRRPSPDVSDELYFIGVTPDGKIKVYEAPWPLEFFKIHSFENLNAQKATWKLGKIYFTTHEDNYVKLHKLELDGTSTELATTSIGADEPYILFAHPDQDYVYLIGENEQWVIKPDSTIATHNYDLTGFVDYWRLGWEINGNVWIMGHKFDKEFNLLESKEDPQNWRCMYTFLLHKNNDKIEMVKLDGSASIEWIDKSLNLVFTSSSSATFPQAYCVPYSEEDVDLLTKNFNVTEGGGNWRGWNGSQWVDFDGTNARVVGEDLIELEDGVAIQFDFSDGKHLVEGDYFWFVVGPGLILDNLTDLHFEAMVSYLPLERKYIDITLQPPTVEDDGTFLWYTIPEASNKFFWYLSPEFIKATFDDPEQTGSGVTAIVKTDGDPQPGEVVIDAQTGRLKFNREDSGRTFQMEYDVVMDYQYPFDD